MLKNLVKRDLIWINKSMIIFFIISFIISGITRGFSYFDDSFVGGILFFVLKACTTACMVAVVINSVIRIWTRFNLNIYRDESYLTHTLPVKRTTIYDSKIISSVISILITLVVIAIDLVIVYFDSSTINKLKDIVNNGSVLYIFITILILSTLEILYMMNCGLNGLIIGHKSNNNKMVKSVFIGIGLYFLIQTIIFVLVFSFGLTNDNVKSLFSSTIDNDLDFESAVKFLMTVVTLIYAVFNLGLYSIGKLLFKKGVNID